MKFAALVLVLAVALTGCSREKMQKSRETSLKQRDAKVHELYEQKKYVEAAREAANTVSAAEKQYGPSAPEMAVPLSNMAGLYVLTGRLPEAEAAYTRLLDILEEYGDPSGMMKPQTLHDLATISMQNRKFDEAEEYERRVLEIREATLKAGDPLIASALNNLGYICLVVGKNDNAEPMLLRASEILGNSVGPDHPFMDVTMTHLAQLYRQTGRMQNAESVLQQLLERRLKRLGPSHVEVGRAHNNLAIVNREYGYYDKAVQNFDAALKIFEAQSARFAEERRIVIQNYAQALDQAGRKDEATEMLKRLSGGSTGSPQGGAPAMASAAPADAPS